MEVGCGDCKDVQEEDEGKGNEVVVCVEQEQVEAG